VSENREDMIKYILENSEDWYLPISKEKIETASLGTIEFVYRWIKKHKKK